MDFVHPRIGEEVEAIGGYYLFIKEEIIDHPSGRILYLVGCAVTDRACCGPSGCGYAVVAGRIMSLHSGRTDGDRPVSSLEPLPPILHDEIARYVRSREGVSQVQFLLEDGQRAVLF